MLNDGGMDRKGAGVQLKATNRVPLHMRRRPSGCVGLTLSSNMVLVFCDRTLGRFAVLRRGNVTVVSRRVFGWLKRET